MKVKEKERATMTLGGYLYNQRQRKKMTLREVEEATDHAVSNAYLSQLENDKIAKPSPNILFSLSSVYGIPYATLMEKAGYISDVTDRQKGKHGRVATFADENLTQEEEEVLLEYLAFLRNRKGKK